MCSLNSFCPVPFDQQPLNEFYELKNSCFFSFFGFKLSQYLYRLFIICLIIFFILMPVILSIIKFAWSIFLIDELFCIIIALSLILMRLYLGWSYILYRLFSATVFYEESGWYDGQMWLKTPEIIIKDRLVGTYYILPLLNRIKMTFGILMIFMVIDVSFYSLLC